MDKAYLEDLAPGQVFTSPARAVVGADAIKQFAGEFDPQPWHLNETIARSSLFKELVASGWHTTALTMQLIIQTLPLSEGIIGSGVDELRWPRPVRPGRQWRCGVLMPLAANDPVSLARIGAFLQSLQELSWTDGRNVRMEYRWVAGNAERVYLRRNWSRSRQTSFWPVAPRSWHHCCRRPAPSRSCS